MATPQPRDTPSQRLARLLDLWGQLQHADDPKERRTLEQRIRKESDAYKRVTKRAVDS